MKWTTPKMSRNTITETQVVVMNFFLSFGSTGAPGSEPSLGRPASARVVVTALDSGRRIIVRVNDRGPFATGRVIDLSRGAAEQLGVRRKGIARVRVRVVQPPEKVRKRLRDGEAARPLADEKPAILANLREQFAIGMGSQGSR